MSQYLTFSLVWYGNAARNGIAHALYIKDMVTMNNHSKYSLPEMKTSF